MRKIILAICILFLCCQPLSFAKDEQIIGKQGVSRGILVYIPSNAKSEDMKRAFKEWTAVSKNRITFKFINSPSMANIKVNFVDTVTHEHTENAIGLASNNTYRNGGIKHTEIYIAQYTKTSPPVKLNNKEVYSTMIHEVGHALGLNHSQNPKSVMYYASGENTAILPSDIETLNKIYGLK